MKVAIAGATGFVGTRLVARLHQDNAEIIVLTRNPERARRVLPASTFPRANVVHYDPKQSGNWQQAISGCTGVVNLAGTPIADQRWTPTYKQSILESRQVTTAKLVEAIEQASEKPSVLVNASAVGYYGTSETTAFDESSPPGRDFLAQVCQQWEERAHRVEAAGVRLAILRFGIVLGPGGALGKMLTPFQFFAGGPIGSGRQWVSWVHRDDVVQLIVEALSNPAFSGVYNATAPNPVRMNTLCQTLGEVMHRPSWLPVPAFALELLLGEGATVVLDGQQVLPKHTLSAGFEYRYETVKPALQAALAEFG